MLDFNRMGLTIGQRQSRSQRALANSPIRAIATDAAEVAGAVARLVHGEPR
jgi:hypothetical protein